MQTDTDSQTAADWTANLPTIDAAALRPAIDELAGLEKDTARKLPTGRTTTRTARSIMLDARKRAAAIQDIGELPQAGEVVHLLTAKRFVLFNVIEAVLHFRAPATIRRLCICTLGFSVANVEDLAAMLDNGQVERLDFVFSVFFRSLEKANCERLVTELSGRGQRVVALLQHAKILVIETTDNQSYVIESSANLRSCASLEQIAIFNDADLAAFHRTWIDGLFQERDK